MWISPFNSKRIFPACVTEIRPWWCQPLSPRTNAIILGYTCFQCRVSSGNRRLLSVDILITILWPAQNGGYFTNDIVDCSILLYHVDSNYQDGCYWEAITKMILPTKRIPKWNITYIFCHFSVVKFLALCRIGGTLSYKPTMNHFTDNLGPKVKHSSTLIRACISNHIPSKVWGEITYLFPNLNGSTVEFGNW